MRVLKKLGIVVLGALIGGFGATIVPNILPRVVYPEDVVRLEAFDRFTIQASVIVGAAVAYMIFCRTPKIKTPDQLTPDAEQATRAKSQPSSNPTTDDAAIQPDKRGLKPGDR